METEIPQETQPAQAEEMAVVDTTRAGEEMGIIADEEEGRNSQQSSTPKETRVPASKAEETTSTRDRMKAKGKQD
jgi:hypothetical protein